MSQLVYRERPAAGDANGLLILHHGRGTDENDLFGLADDEGELPAAAEDVAEQPGLAEVRELRQHRR